MNRLPISATPGARCSAIAWFPKKSNGGALPSRGKYIEPAAHPKLRAVFFATLLLITPSLFAEGWKESAVLPALSGFGLEGSLPSLKGKVVYVDFWASWCGPCKASFPVLNKWQGQFGSKGFTVLGVSVDESAADMQGFLKKTAISFPVVRDAAHKLVAAADVSAMPTSFLVDKKGVIRHVHNGFHAKDEATLAAQIAALLAE